MEGRTTHTSPARPGVEAVHDIASHITANVERVIEGKKEAVSTAVIVLLAGGHLLVEDIPGVGKTMLAKALGRSIDARVSRIQFTPDLLPTDITGVSIYDPHTQRFSFAPGSVFAPIVVGDEINRASPKTQSALLEAMEERQVSVDGNTHRLPGPFMVVATQNPMEMEGTFPLPEAQRDRFMARMALGYPTHRAEVEMLDTHGSEDPLTTLAPVVTAHGVTELISLVSGVYASPAIKDYLVRIVEATRSSPDLRLGASPRASLHLLKAGRAAAACEGRDFVLPDDVARLAPTVLAHRLIPKARSHLSIQDLEDLVARLVAAIRVPSGRR